MGLKERLLKLEKNAVVPAPPHADWATLGLERDWRDWLPAMGPHTFTRPFGFFHEEFWAWYWEQLWKLRRGEALVEEKKAFLAFWPRGYTKSSTVEWGAIAEGALVGKGYVLYVSGTRDLAEEHVQTIKERLESEEVARHYPHLAAPKIGRHGNQYGWRQDFLVTEGGWAIRPVGLLEGVRGARVGDLRPTLIVFDDVDELDDSPDVSEKKAKRIARSIIPAGTAGTRYVFAQNLIAEYSVANRILTRKLDILSRRIESGPYPAFDGLEVEHRVTEDGPRSLIVAGRATWPDLDVRACQDFLDNSGLEAFYAEYQHDFSRDRSGLVIPEYDEKVHIITWSEFAEVYGTPYVPEHWDRQVGMDWGSTEGHPAVISFTARAAANSQLPGKRFLYRGKRFPPGVLVSDVAAWVKRECAGDYSTGRAFDELPLVTSWRFSHERKTERDTFRVEHSIPFVACKPGRDAGLALLREWLKVDYDSPHPFRPGEKGNASFYWVVDDDQLHAARDDRGLERHRFEVVNWRYRREKLTETGLTRDEPVKAADDAMNSLEMCAQTFGPRETPLTPEEREDKSLPAGWRRESAPAYGGWQRDGWEMARDAYLSMQKEQQGGGWRRREASEWRFGEGGGGNDWTPGEGVQDQDW
jgi:hypothetical protein